MLNFPKYEIVKYQILHFFLAWQLLCDRFDIKRLLIQNHVSALFNIDSITKEYSVILKRLIDQINKSLRALESQREPVKYWDTLLIYIITQKLDTKTYREWEEYKGSYDKNNSITFQIFMEFIKNRANLIETLEMSRSCSNSNQSTVKPNNKLRTMVSVQGQGQGRSFSSSTESAVKLCVKCKGEHQLYNCPQKLAVLKFSQLDLVFKRISHLSLMFLKKTK